MAVGDGSVREGEGAVPFKPLQTPATWIGSELPARESEWKYQLKTQDVDEILSATEHALATGKPIVVRSCLQALQASNPSCKQLMHGLACRGF
jgi:hypothetical protein